MLMAVLKGELAVKQRKALIRIFKQMKDYIVENQGLIGTKEFYDRYIIIDRDRAYQRFYNSGASSEDAGQRITSVKEVVDQMIYTALIGSLLKNPVLQLK